MHSGALAGKQELDGNNQPIVPGEIPEDFLVSNVGVLWPSQLGWAILYLLLYSRACGRARIPLQLDMLSHEAQHIEISEMRMSCIPSRLHLPGESFR